MHSFADIKIKRSMKIICLMLAISFYGQDFLGQNSSNKETPSSINKKEVRAVKMQESKSVDLDAKTTTRETSTTGATEIKTTNQFSPAKDERSYRVEKLKSQITHKKREEVIKSNK